MVTSSFQMLNKFINVGSWVNIDGWPLFWCSRKRIVMLFCHETALFMGSKNVWYSPSQITFVKRSGILL